MVSNKIILIGLRSEWVSMIGRIKTCYIDHSNAGESEHPENGMVYTELIGLDEDYNNLVSRTLTILTNTEREIINLGIINFSRRKIVYSRDAYGNEKKGDCINSKAAELTLKRMNQGASKATAIIDEMLKNTNVSSEGEKELQSLINIIDEKILLVLPLCSTDLKYSIGEFRKGDLLGAILISGRTIDIIYDKLTKLARVNKKDITQDEINEFIQANLFGDDKGGGRLALRGIILYRNKFSHNIGIYPKDENETITVISSCVSIITKILDKKLVSTLDLK